MHKNDLKFKAFVSSIFLTPKIAIRKPKDFHNWGEIDAFTSSKIPKLWKRQRKKPDKGLWIGWETGDRAFCENLIGENIQNV